MALAKLNAAQAATIRLARQSASDDDRKAIKREVFAAVKAAFGIPADHKLRADVDANSDNFGVLVNSKTRQTYELDGQGKWTGATTTASSPLVWVRIRAESVRALLRNHVCDEDDTSSSVGGGTFDHNEAVFFHHGDTAIDMDGNGWVQVSAASMAD